jgi:hypothetical protein
MNTYALEKVVLIHTRECFSWTCARLMQESVAQLENAIGCMRCQLETVEPRVGHWAIHCAWNSIDAMRASLEHVFQPAFDALIAQDALLSIQVCEANSAGAAQGVR